jgi:NRAMP (natural resistance-associated macrophage protein)-like metal ion transporter
MYLRRLGPGFVTGASDDDPAGIGTYVQAGARFGYLQLWTALFTFPIMAVVQEMCGRIGRVTGLGLSVVMRKKFHLGVCWTIVAVQVFTNTLNVGADISAMAQSAQLLWHLPFIVWLGITTVLTAALIVAIPYRRYVNYLKVLGLTLLAYVACAFFVEVDWHAALVALVVPHISFERGFMLTLVAVLGVTISPYEFFWQDDEEIEELIEDGVLVAGSDLRPQTTRKDIAALRADTTLGMFFSNLVTAFIIIVAAAALHTHGRTDVETAAQAAAMFRPLAGPFAGWLFTAGIVGAGLLSIPVMAASSAYAIGGLAGWRDSLSDTFLQAPRFYAVIAGSCLIGILVNLLHIPPFKLLLLSGVLSGVVSPIMLFVVLRLANDRDIMGEFTNGWFSNALGWILCVGLIICLGASIWES